MKRKITLYGHKDNMILELLVIKNNRIVKRIEKDNKKEIQIFLNSLINEMKSVKESNEKIEVSFDENVSLTIFNYSLLKEDPILDEVGKKLRALALQKKKNHKKRNTYATIFALGAATVMSLSDYQRKVDDENSAIKIETESNRYDINTDITILNANLEIVTPQQVKTEFHSQHYIEAKEAHQNFTTFFPEIGSKKDDERKQNVETAYSHLTEKYAAITGIDQELLECILAQERGFHSAEKDAGGAIGVAQIQVGVHKGETLYLRNVQTGITESFTVTEEMMKDLEGNMKIFATLLQNELDYYDGNTLIFLQTYNFGYGAMDQVLKNASMKLEIDVDSILNDYTNFDWIKSVSEYSNSQGGYGDPDYCKNVLSFYNEDEFTIKYNKNGENIKISINNLENEKSHGL